MTPSAILLSAFIAFLHAVSSFVFRVADPWTHAFHRFFNLPFWVVLLVALACNLLDWWRSTWLYRASHNYYHHHSPGLPYQHTFPVNFHPLPVLETSVPPAERDITSASPLSATRRRQHV